jgi:D-alanyl-D-alanine-carboxypeptidase/D-alanyl-D-alanine-endopeptidase
MVPRCVRIVTVLAIAGLAVAACSRGSSPPKPATAPRPPPPMSAADLDTALAALFQETGSPGMVVAVVRGDQVIVRGYGKMGPNDPRQPDGATLVRLESISKLLTSQVMLTLAANGKLRVDDPLQRYAPADCSLPQTTPGRPIELADLATHTSGLPREADFAPVTDRAKAEAARWAWLKRQKALPAPGSAVLYSNAGFDLLADALAVPAKEPYPAALSRWVTTPWGMADTTPSPSAAQCARLLTPDVDGPPRPCVDEAATAGSGGVYSTANDMGRWMQHILAPGHGGPVGLAAQAIVYRREAFTTIKGMDHAGPAAGLGHGWVELAGTPDYPRLLEKTGGGSGFLTYIAIAPGERAGVFVAVDKIGHRSFKAITRGVNALMGPLTGLPTAPAMPPMVITAEDEKPPVVVKPEPRRPRRHHRRA